MFENVRTQSSLTTYLIISETKIINTIFPKLPPMGKQITSLRSYSIQESST